MLTHKPEAVLIVPLNDPEAFLIAQFARHLGLQMIHSQQPHGASLDTEPDILPLLKSGGWKKVIVVEMPGPTVEKKIARKGIELVIIDHHHYTHLDRAHHARTGQLLPSSLEQFIELFKITDRQLKKWGFDPILVRGIGIMDRGFIWALRKEGYKERDVRRVVRYWDRLSANVSDEKHLKEKTRLARRAWKARKRWGSFLLVTNPTTKGIRLAVSFIVALELKQPTALIVSESKRGMIYVQESPHAIALFHEFGGFTFGMDRNWGYKWEKGKKKVGLQDVKKFLKKFEA